MKMNTCHTMFLFKDVTKRIHAYVDRWCTVGGEKGIKGHLRFAFMSVIASVLMASVSPIGMTDQLSDTVSSIDAQVTQTSATVSDLTRVVISLINKYKLTNAEKCALLVVGTSNTNSVPIYFVPGPLPISALQADIVSLPLLVTSVATGPEATAVGKTVTAIGPRFLLFGFNQTALIPGTIAIANFDISQTGTGDHIVSLTNFSASSPDGSAVPICMTSGVLTK